MDSEASVPCPQEPAIDLILSQMNPVPSYFIYTRSI
jgi:hypothetical protein